jgi:hypothetical protein
VTGASRFLIGLVSCFATRDGIPARVIAAGADRPRPLAAGAATVAHTAISTVNSGAEAKK